MSSVQREVFRDYLAKHEDQTFSGSRHETLEERADRRRRERIEDALVASAELQSAEEALDAAIERSYREAHPTKPSEEMLDYARAYIRNVDAMIANGTLVVGISTNAVEERLK